MNEFDVLQINQKIFGNFFLEASAGTGKTFTIEHLFLRLILEAQDLNLNQILVITFTKKATFELISRIKNNLEKTLLNLKENSLENLPKYIPQNKNVKQFYNKILTAYLRFPSNSIFTIHGFCYYLLNTFFIGKVNIETILSKPEYILDASRHYLTNKQFLDLLNKEQIKKLVTRYPKNLDVEITSQIIKKSLKEEYPSLKKIKQNLNIGLDNLKSLCCSYSSSELYNIMISELKKFKNTCNRQKQLKKSIENNLVITIENLLNKENFFIQEGWINSPLIHISKDNIKQNQSPLHIISQTIIDLKISELLSNYFNPKFMIKWISSEIIEKEINQNSIIKEDDILSLTLSCLQQFPKITEKIKNFYSAVLVDEFQDTDPIQWDIIKLLFLDQTKPIASLFLIGDPKQAIYGFRNADIYTYKNAQNNFLASNIFSLKTNYRSTPQLVSVINFLFSRDENLFYLPKNKESISYHQLKDNPKNQYKYIEKTPCHFLIEETEKDLFNAINKEIFYLINEIKIPINKIAILIKDQNQGIRFSNSCPFPINTNKSIDLAESCSTQIFKSFLAACMNPHLIHLLIPVLLGPLFLKTINEIFDNLNTYMNLFFSYQKILFSSGILELFYCLTKQQGEFILQQHQGQILYQEMEYIVDKLYSLTTNPNNYLYLLEKMCFLSDLDEKLKANFSEISEDALQMLTIHAAKGMEFEVVFPVGLIKSHSLSYIDNKEEIYAEKIRQTYVAFTRAKTFLYIPVLKKEEPFSPLSLFLNRILQKKDIKDLSQSYPKLFSYSQNTEKIAIAYQKKIHFINKPSISKFSFLEKNKLISFSKIKKDTIFIKNEINSKPTNNNIGNNSGLEFGSLCHFLLEKINFSSLQKTSDFEQMQKLIEPFFSPKQQIWLDYIASILFNLFNSLLNFPEDAFYLKDINQFKIFRENEFLFIDNDQKTFVKGFIDLFFEHNNKFYVIDWKTNFLGDNSSDYTPDKLHTFASNMQYDKQIHFYLKATKKYLKNFLERPSICYGALIFLRGLTNNTGMIYY